MTDALDLYREDTGGIPGYHCRVRDAAQVGRDHHVPEVDARQTDNLGQLLSASMGHGQDSGVHASLPGQIRKFGQGLFEGRPLE